MLQPYGRRQFLQSSLALAAVLGARSAQAEESVEALIIGSGFGGAIAALRLAEAGIHSVVLERGRRWPITASQDTFCTNGQPDGRAAWLSTTTIIYTPTPIERYTGILDVKVTDSGVLVYRGAGVGGGSLVYNGVTYQPPRQFFDGAFGGLVDYDELDSIYYPRVRAILRPAPVPDDILATPYYAGTRTTIALARQAGLTAYPVDTAVDWNIVRQELAGTARPSAIVGDWVYGINSGAKNSVDRNYLAMAEATGRVTVLPLHLATTITALSDGGFRVTCNQIDESGQVVTTRSFVCRTLFLAAGSMGTSELLLRSRSLGGLSALSPSVGLYWGTNGDSTVFHSNLPLTTNGGQGGPAGAIIEDLSNPISPLIMENFPYHDLREGTLFYAAIGLVPPSGSFVYEARTDRTRLHWPLSAAQTMLDATEHTLARINQAIRTNQRAVSSALIGPRAGGHPLGGAVMGQVCDSYGKVYGYQNLYVVDGPDPRHRVGCANPSLTIAALAERALDRFLAQRAG